jgi:hypothetical protein
MLTLQEYNSMNTANLVDILAQETQKFTHLMTAKEVTSDYDQCKTIIKLVQAIIESRQETGTSQSPFLVGTIDPTS